MTSPIQIYSQAHDNPEWICPSCIWDDADLCLNDIPRNVCEDKSYHGGGDCWFKPCKPELELDPEIYGVCLKYEFMDFYCSCEDRVDEPSCLHFTVKGTWHAGLKCEDLAFAECPNPEDEPCTKGPDDHFVSMCYHDCMATFAPVVQDMLDTCFDDHEPDSPELCQCWQNAEITNCEFKLACLQLFDNSYKTDGAWSSFNWCLNRVVQCPIGDPARARSMDERGGCPPGWCFAECPDEPSDWGSGCCNSPTPCEGYCTYESCLFTGQQIYVDVGDFKTNCVRGVCETESCENFHRSTWIHTDEYGYDGNGNIEIPINVYRHECGACGSCVTSYCDPETTEGFMFRDFNLSWEVVPISQWYPTPWDDIEHDDAFPNRGRIRLSHGGQQGCLNEHIISFNIKDAFGGFGNCIEGDGINCPEAGVEYGMLHLYDIDWEASGVGSPCGNESLCWKLSTRTGNGDVFTDGVSYAWIPIVISNIDGVGGIITPDSVDFDRFCQINPTLPFCKPDNRNTTTRESKTSPLPTKKPLEMWDGRNELLGNWDDKCTFLARTDYDKHPENECKLVPCKSNDPNSTSPSQYTDCEWKIARMSSEKCQEYGGFFNNTPNGLLDCVCSGCEQDSETNDAVECPWNPYDVYSQIYYHNFDANNICYASPPQYWWFDQEQCPNNARYDENGCTNKCFKPPYETDFPQDYYCELLDKNDCIGCRQDSVLGNVQRVGNECCGPFKYYPSGYQYIFVNGGCAQVRYMNENVPYDTPLGILSFRCLPVQEQNLFVNNFDVFNPVHCCVRRMENWGGGKGTNKATCTDINTGDGNFCGHCDEQTTVEYVVTSKSNNSNNRDLVIELWWGDSRLDRTHNGTPSLYHWNCLGVDATCPSGSEFGGCGGGGCGEGRGSFDIPFVLEYKIGTEWEDGEWFIPGEGEYQDGKLEGIINIQGGSNKIYILRNVDATEYPSLDMTKATLTLDFSSLPVTTNGKRRDGDDTPRGILWLDSFDCDSSVGMYRDYFREDDDNVVIQIRDIPFGSDPSTVPCDDFTTDGTCCHFSSAYGKYICSHVSNCQQCMYYEDGCFSEVTCTKRTNDGEVRCCDHCHNTSQCDWINTLTEYKTSPLPTKKPLKRSNKERQNFWEKYTEEK